MSLKFFDVQVAEARRALEVANRAYDDCIDRLAARTEADDGPGGDLEEVQALFRRVQVDCWSAEARLMAVEAMAAAWSAIPNREQASQEELLAAFRQALEGGAR